MEICIGLGSSFTFDITCVTYRETYPQGVFLWDVPLFNPLGLGVVFYAESNEWKNQKRISILLENERGYRKDRRRLSKK